MNINRVTKIEQNPLFEEHELNNQSNGYQNMQNGNNATNTQIQKNIQEDDDPLASIKEELMGMIESGEGATEGNTENAEQQVVQPKRGRGRPKKVQPQPIQDTNIQNVGSNINNNTSTSEMANVLPGFENISISGNESIETQPVQPKRGRGRPKKVQSQPTQTINAQSNNSNVNNTQKLSNNIEDGYENIVANKNAQPSVNLFDLVDDIEENNNSYNTPTTNNKMPTETILPGFEDEEENVDSQDYREENHNIQNDNNYMPNNNNYVPNTQSLQYTQSQNIDFTRLFTSDKKQLLLLELQKWYIFLSK